MHTTFDDLQWSSLKAFLGEVQPQFRALQYTTTACSGLVIAYTIYILTRNLIEYKAGGLSCLLVCLIGLFGLFMGLQTLQLNWLYKLIEASEPGNQSEWKRIERTRDWFAVSQGMIYLLPAVVYWIYSFKVWTLSKQLHAIFTKQEMVSSTKLIVLFSAGVVISILQGAIVTIDLIRSKVGAVSHWTKFSGSLLTGLLSLIVVVDGFYRINKLDMAFVVPKCTSLLHTSSFVVYLLALLLTCTWTQFFEGKYFIEGWRANEKETTVTVIIYGVFYFVLSVSLIMLLFILHILLQKQGSMQNDAQHEDNDAESLLSADDDVSISINRQTETEHQSESGVGAPFTFYDGSFVNSAQR